MGIIKYIKETRNELRHVSWPTRRQAVGYTIIVVIVSVLIAYFLGLFDLGFTKGLESIIAR